MPVYEYRCQNGDCSEITETLRKVAERDDSLTCPKCGSGTQRKVSESSFRLKGGGWYKDGYAG